MNKLFYLAFFAMSALMLSSCSEDDSINDSSDVTPGNNGTTEKVVFTAAIVDDEDPSFRTTVDISGGKGIIKWYDNDAIAVVNTNNTFDAFTLATGSGTTTATFEGNFTEGTTGGNIAIYPAGAHTYDGTTLTVNLPDTYGDFDTPYTPNANVLMIAQKTGDEDVLYFMHLGGVLYFDVDVPVGTTSVSLKAKGISGDFTVDMSGEYATITQAADAQDATVTYRFKAFETAKTETFYFPVPVGTYQNFMITLTNNDGIAINTLEFDASKRLSRTTIAKMPAVNGSEMEYEYLDLGLSVLWATTNVGATSPEEYGEYFSWGDWKAPTVENGSLSSEVGSYNWHNYEYYEGDDDNDVTLASEMSKYNETDGLTALEAMDDVAVAIRKDNSRMPTKAELQELIDECDWTWDADKKGYKVASKKNGNFIFLPAGGYLRMRNTDKTLGTYCCYWSSSLDPFPSNSELGTYMTAWYLEANATTRPLASYFRYLGMPVRPVFSK